MGISSRGVSSNTTLFARGTEGPPGVGREAVLEEGVLLHELKSSSLSSCNGSRLCLSGVGVMGEDVEMDIDRRFQLRALRKVAGSEEPGPRGVLRDNVEDRRGGDQGISIKR